MFTRIEAMVPLYAPHRTTPLAGQLTVDNDTGEITIKALDVKSAERILEALEQNKILSLYVTMDLEPR